VQQIILILFSFIIWLGLTWTLNLQNLIVGGVVSILVGLLFGKLFTNEPYKVIQPKRWFWFLVYIPKFVWEMAKANFDVAYRVIHPMMPINPGIVKVKTRIKSEMGKAFLANSITLTPGTFTVDLKDQYLYIHCINVRHTDVDEASEDIVSRFEKLLIKIFD
jgi:multicomponent Na+:H+ antiporter subunit E